MRTEHLSYILEVARSNSISAAAKKLFIGQTTLSAIIQSIETELNIQIFERTHRGISLTPYGEQAIALIEDIVAKSDALHHLFNEHPARRTTIHLVMYPCACNALSLYLTQKVSQFNKYISLCIHETSYNKVVSKVFQGAARISVGVDLVNANTGQPEIGDHGLYSEYLYTDYFYLVAKEGTTFADRTEVAVEELYDEHLALSTHFYPASGETPLSRFFKRFPQFSLFTNNEIIKKALLQSDDMVSIMPGLAFYNDLYLRSGTLKLIPLSGLDIKLNNYLAYDDTRKRLDPADQFIIENIKEFYEALPLTMDRIEEYSLKKF